MDRRLSSLFADGEWKLWILCCNYNIINVIIKIVAYFSCLSGLLRNYCDLRSQLKFVVRGNCFSLKWFWKSDSLSGCLQLIPFTLCIRELIHWDTARRHLELMLVSTSACFGKLLFPSFLFLVIQRKKQYT